MGLFDSILGAVAGQTDPAAGSSPIMGILSGVLAQSGGLQGLANQFAKSGHGDIFSSWVSNGQNQQISADQIQKVLGSSQVQALGAKFGVDPTQVSHFLAQYLPQIVDGLTPNGTVDPNANHQQNLASLIPTLMQSLGGKAAT